MYINHLHICQQLHKSSALALRVSDVALWALSLLGYRKCTLTRSTKDVIIGYMEFACQTSCLSLLTVLIADVPVPIAVSVASQNISITIRIAIPSSNIVLPICITTPSADGSQCTTKCIGG